MSGQSVLEFALLVPVIVGILSLLVEVEMAINTAIVNQKYARQHLHFLFFNHRYYPELRFLAADNKQYFGRFWVGVDDKITPPGSEPTPRAPVRKIGRQKADDSPGEVDSRQNVRIRVAVLACAPPVGINVGQTFSEGYIDENTFRSGNYKYCEY